MLLSIFSLKLPIILVNRLYFPFVWSIWLCVQCCWPPGDANWGIVLGRSLECGPGKGQKIETITVDGDTKNRSAGGQLSEPQAYYL